MPRNRVLPRLDGTIHEGRHAKSAGVGLPRDGAMREHGATGRAVAATRSRGLAEVE